jgi:hypothetical protein
VRASRVAWPRRAGGGGPSQIVTIRPSSCSCRSRSSGGPLQASGFQFVVNSESTGVHVSRSIPPNVTIKISHAATARTLDSRLSTGPAAELHPCCRSGPTRWLSLDMRSSTDMELPRQSVNDLARSKRPDHGSGRLVVRAQNRAYLAKNPWDLQGTSSASRRCPSASILAASLAAAQPGRSCQEYLTQYNDQGGVGGKPRGEGFVHRRPVLIWHFWILTRLSMQRQGLIGLLTV